MTIARRYVFQPSGMTPVSPRVETEAKLFVSAEDYEALQQRFEAAVEELTGTKARRADLRQLLKETKARLVALQRLGGIEQLRKVAEWDCLTRSGVAEALRDDVAENLSQPWYTSAIHLLAELVDNATPKRSAP